MQKTITALSTEITKSQTYIDRGCRANETPGAADAPGAPTRDDQASSRCGRCVGHRGRCSSGLLGRRAAACSRRCPRTREHADGAGRLGGQGPGAAAARHPERRRASASCRLHRHARGRREDRRRRGSPTSPGSATASTCRCCPGAGNGSWPSRRSCSARSSSGVKKYVAPTIRLDEQPERHLEGHPGQGRRRLVPLRDDQPGRVQQRLHGPHRRRRRRCPAPPTRSTPARSTQDALRAFFKGQTLTAGCSGFLADTYVRQQDTLDGIINYESVLMSLNAGGKLHEPLALDLPQGRHRHRRLPASCCSTPPSATPTTR